MSFRRDLERWQREGRSINVFPYDAGGKWKNVTRTLQELYGLLDCPMANEFSQMKYTADRLLDKTGAAWVVLHPDRRVKKVVFGTKSGRDFLEVFTMTYDSVSGWSYRGTSIGRQMRLFVADVAVRIENAKSKRDVREWYRLQCN